MSVGDLLVRGAPLALAAVLLGGCGAGRSGDTGRRAIAANWAHTRQFGVGRAFRPPPFGAEVGRAGPVGTLRCAAGGGRRYGAHVELFAQGRGVWIPAGIGLAPPQRLAAGRVVSARCAYPLRTVEPTGVVEVDPLARPTPTLGALFALWGQPLGPRRLAGFRAAPQQRVLAFVNGRRWPGDPRRVPLGRHATIVVEVGPFVLPHATYRFAGGL